MPRFVKVHALWAAALALAGLAAAVAPATSDAYVDEWTHVCRAEGDNPCAYGLIVTSWHRPGSGPRTVSWVYATRSPVNPRNQARWWYQAPGGTARVGGSWRGGRTVMSWTEIAWGSGGRDRIGPELPAGSRICVEFNYGATARPCITLR
ncbi:MULTISPECIES: hypothetical protein [unclassified Streptomyces]|uniref:hypothetical protein n=1 Tax=unclassified Streptomyces TaxID=2593676 RepID=UPI0038057223